MEEQLIQQTAILQWILVLMVLIVIGVGITAFALARASKEALAALAEFQTRLKAWEPQILEVKGELLELKEQLSTELTSVHERLDVWEPRLEAVTTEVTAVTSQTALQLKRTTAVIQKAEDFWEEHEPQIADIIGSVRALTGSARETVNDFRANILPSVRKASTVANAVREGIGILRHFRNNSDTPLARGRDSQPEEE